MRLALLLFFLAFDQPLFAGDTSSVTIHFAFNKYEIDADAMKVIDNFLADSNKIITNIRITGYCDQVGSDTYNNQLSLKRANEVKQYLLSKTIKKNIISPVTGKGEKELLRTGMTESERQENRRVIISIEYNKGLSAEENKKSLKEKVISNETGQKIILKNINFYGGSHQFLPQSLPALDELLQALSSIPSLEIEIQGHVCCGVGEEDGYDNETGIENLSTMRAKAVYDFLIRNGIDKKRLSYVGLAHRFPLVPEHTAEDLTTNRRVEIKITKK